MVEKHCGMIVRRGVLVRHWSGELGMYHPIDISVVSTLFVPAKTWMCHEDPVVGFHTVTSMHGCFSPQSLAPGSPVFVYLNSVSSTMEITLDGTFLLL